MQRKLSCAMKSFPGQDDKEENLREKAARLQAILDTTVDGMITIDERAVVLSFNKAAEKIFGYPAAEVIGRNVNILMPSPYRENHDTYVANYLKTGNRKIIGRGREVRGRRADGSTFPLYLAVSEVRVEDRRFFAGILRDITGIKQAEEALRRAKDELEERVRERTAQLEAANERLRQEIGMRREKEEELRIYAARLERSNRDLQDFSFVASHDLQEPLRKIRTFCDKIEKSHSERLDENGRDYFKRVRGAAKRMQDLIEDVLDYSRLSTRAGPFAMEDLSRVVRDVIIDLKEPVEKADARIEVGELPSIEVDSGQIRRLFQNLLSNALKFRASESPVIKVQAQRLGEGAGPRATDPGSDELYWISVEDNGIGFDEKYLDRIFMPFERLHSGNSPYEGTGMGLAVCRKIVERHGGTITARSAPGKGATFIVVLPKRQNDWSRRAGIEAN